MCTFPPATPLAPVTRVFKPFLETDIGHPTKLALSWLSCDVYRWRGNSGAIVRGSLRRWIDNHQRRSAVPPFVWRTHRKTRADMFSAPADKRGQVPKFVNDGTHHKFSHGCSCSHPSQPRLIHRALSVLTFLFYLQHRRTPVLGDDVYGNKDWNRRLQQSTGLTRPLLHAHSLEFKHPSTGELISIVAPLPADIEAVVRRIYPQVRDLASEGCF